jgi:hypothetical protein
MSDHYSISAGHKRCSVKQSASIFQSTLLVICVVLLISPSLFTACSLAGVVTYPAPPGLRTSPDFKVEVNNIPVWVERIGSKLDSFKYSLYSGRDMEDLNVAAFSCSGSVTVKISASSEIDSFIIRPKSREITAKVSGNELTFNIPGPQKLYLEINNLPHLAIFANPPEVNPSKEGEPGVLFFGPGSHIPGKITLESSQILYARGGGRTGGHSGFSIVCDGPAWVRNIRYEDIRIEENVEFKNLELIVTNGTLYGDDPPGHIRGIYLKNIQWENTEKPFILSGFSEDNLVEDVTFENCKAGGKTLTSTDDAKFIINPFVRNINFIH